MSERSKPKMEHVSSANLLAIGYDEQSQVLHVDFHSGSYEFEDVPREVYQDLKRAPSKGRAFNELIKGRYREKRS